MIVSEIWTKKSPCTRNAIIPAISTYQKSLHKMDPERVKNHYSKESNCFQTFISNQLDILVPCPAILKGPLFCIATLFLYWFIILSVKLKGSLQKFEVSEFFVNFFKLWHYYWPRKTGNWNFIKKWSFLIRKWSVLSNQLFQMKLDMA